MKSSEFLQGPPPRGGRRMSRIFREHSLNCKSSAALTQFRRFPTRPMRIFLREQRWRRCSTVERFWFFQGCFPLCAKQLHSKLLTIINVISSRKRGIAMPIHFSPGKKSRTVLKMPRFAMLHRIKSRNFADFNCIVRRDASFFDRIVLRTRLLREILHPTRAVVKCLPLQTEDPEHFQAQFSRMIRLKSGKNCFFNY